MTPGAGDGMAGCSEIGTADQWPRPTADGTTSTHKCVDGRDRPSRTSARGAPSKRDRGRNSAAPGDPSVSSSWNVAN